MPTQPLRQIRPPGAVAVKPVTPALLTGRLPIASGRSLVPAPVARKSFLSPREVWKDTAAKQAVQVSFLT